MYMHRNFLGNWCKLMEYKNSMILDCKIHILFMQTFTTQLLTGLQMLRSRRVWRRLQVTRRKTWSTNWLNTTDILTKLKSATERSSRRSMLISQRQMFSHKVILINKIEKNFSQYFVRCIVDYPGRFFISHFHPFP